MIAPHQRGLPGVKGKFKAPTTPIEVTSAVFDGACHSIVKQLGAACVSGIDQWSVETACGRRVIVTKFAEVNGQADCETCLNPKKKTATLKK